MDVIVGPAQSSKRIRRTPSRMRLIRSIFLGYQDDAQVPQDRLYSLYVGEAEKYDAALAARLKTSSDTLLIFVSISASIFILYHT